MTNTATKPNKAPKPNIIHDSAIMFRRCMKIALRSPEATAQAIIIPIFLMAMFGLVFGGMVDMGSVNYVTFVVPGIIFQAVSQSSAFAAINVCTDMTKGIMDRYRSMPISHTSVLVGHILTSIVRNTVTTLAIIGTAFVIGFSPRASFLQWLAVVGLLLLTVTLMTCFAVLCGLRARSAEDASGSMFPLFILPFVSSGFSPTDTFPAWLRWFADHQPMTPIINAIRDLMLGGYRPGSTGTYPGADLWIALSWLVGLTVLCFGLSVRIFKRKLV